MEQSSYAKMTGWGRFEWARCHAWRPERRRAVNAILGAREYDGYIARGLGRSYGDTAVNAEGGVIDMSRLNRMISFDAATGILDCEAGVSLGEILQSFVPRGFLVPVMPGTKFVTLGGAIACDVHGKNHHVDKSFGNHVVSLDLLTARGEVLTCSAEKNPELFRATIGGIGLTGIILSARIQLARIESAYFKVDFKRTTSLEDTLAAFDESDDDYQYSVAWVDCISRGARLGRAVLMRGRKAMRSDIPATRDPFAIKSAFPKAVPFDLPGFALNRLSIRAFNEVYYRAHRDAPGTLVNYDAYFCPLDSIHSWNRMYGKRGFVQYQVTFPLGEAGRKNMREMLERLQRFTCGSFLAVLKRLGEGNDSPLSYPSPGYLIALDIPARRDTATMLQQMDLFVLERGGRIYFAKDAVAKAETIAAMYPRLDEFKQAKAKVDPNNLFTSNMARRLGLLPA
jgi:FAD/FMN-containing dehydrogenase